MTTSGAVAVDDNGTVVSGPVVGCSKANGAVGGSNGGGVSGVSNSESTTPTTRLAKYQLYAVVVHSGMSMDAGHYYTYASDEPDSWYMFNDSYVTRCGAEDVHRLRAPNTPYILFYRRLDQDQQADEQPQPPEEVELEEVVASGGAGGQMGESLPELEELPSYLKDFVVKDNFTYCQEMQKGGGGGQKKDNGGGAGGRFNNRRNDDNDSDSDDQPPPQSSCGGNAIDSSNSYIC